MFLLILGLFIFGLGAAVIGGWQGGLWMVGLGFLLGIMGLLLHKLPIGFGVHTLPTILGYAIVMALLFCLIRIGELYIEGRGDEAFDNVGKNAIEGAIFGVIFGASIMFFEKKKARRGQHQGE